MSEFCIRKWKKQPFWEVEREKIIAERVKTMGMDGDKTRQDFNEKFEQQTHDLEILRDHAKANALRCLAIVNAALTEALKEKSGLKASHKATKAGVHVLSRSAFQAIDTILKINESIYQISIITEHIRKIEEQGD